MRRETNPHDTQNRIPPMLMVALSDNPPYLNKMNEVLEDAFGNLLVTEDASLGP